MNARSRFSPLRASRNAALIIVPRAARCRRDPVKPKRRDRASSSVGSASGMSVSPAGAAGGVTGGSAASIVTSAVLQRPVVRNLVVERIHAIDLIRVVRDRRAIGDERRPRAAALEPVPDERRDRDERVVELAHVKLLDLAAGR